MQYEEHRRWRWVDDWTFGRPRVMYFIYIVILAAAFIPVLMLAIKIDRLAPEDARALANAQVFRQALENFYVDHLNFPDRLNQLENYLPIDKPWPVNPFTKAPVVDTGTTQFNAASSPGNVYYERIYEEGRSGGWRLHIFGGDGELIVHEKYVPMGE